MIIPPGSRKDHREGLRRYLETGRSSILDRRVELPALHANGTELTVEVVITAVASPGGLAFVGLVRDVSRERAVQHEAAASRSLLAQAEELGGVGSFEQDLRTHGVVWSAGMFRLFGLEGAPTPRSLEELFADRIHASDRDAARELLDRLVRERRHRFAEPLRIVRPDGAERTIEFRGRVDHDDNGPIRLVGTARDVTDEMEARAARDTLSYVVDSSVEAILTKSSDGTITSWNRGAERLYGYSALEAIGRPISLIVPPELLEDQSEMTGRVFAGESVQRDEIARMRQDGTIIHVALTLTPVRDPRGRIVTAAIVARDVSERRRQEIRLQYLAEHDYLTGLLNRRRFEEEVERELARSARSGESGALLIVDLDAFKSVNDLAGHAAGDELLTKVARMLTANTRAADVVARLGGDEFAVLLPNTGLARARAAAAKLLDALHACSVEVAGAPFRATASIGVTMFSQEAQVHDLLGEADTAMYGAKQSGRDRISVFTAADATHARGDARRSWYQQIRHAVEHDELELYSQPIIDLASGNTSHCELLLRMRRGDRIIPPTEFLRTAERLGLIHSIDHWVVRRAIAMLAAEVPELRRPVGVNLSGESVAGDPELIGLIRSELDVSGIDPVYLIFEITETAAISNIDDARAFANAIRDLGCRIALDDFGTGFGSFYHLKHLPVDYIKIDHEFVHEVASSDVDQRLVQSIVDVATALGMETVAEAVGDDDTVALLRDLGVDYGQGFFLGEPRPVGGAP